MILEINDSMKDVRGMSPKSTSFGGRRGEWEREQLFCEAVKGKRKEGQVPKIEDILLGLKRPTCVCRHPLFESYACFK